MPALVLMHLQQSTNFRLYIKCHFHHHEKHSIAADRRIQVLMVCHAPHPGCAAHRPASHQLPRCPRSLPGVLAVRGWVLLGVTPPGAGVTAHSTCYHYGRETALHKLVQVFSTKGTVQIRVSYFTSFHFISPSGNT